MDKKLTAHILRHLLNNYFQSKAEMARQFDINERQMQRIMKNLDHAKAGTIALDKAICYCAQQNISLDRILMDFKGGVHIDAIPVELSISDEAYSHLRLHHPEGLTQTGEDVYRSMLYFLQLASAKMCPCCRTWCNPWDGKHSAENMECYIGHLAREIVRDIAQLYTEEGDYECLK